jgi:ABC-type multidrug transport system fused ATPase/permease subunit
MYVAAAINFTSTTMDLGKNLIGLFQMLGYLDPFMEFMTLPDEVDFEGKIKFTGDVETIEFRDVSFKYPASEKLVLENISFKINKGEKVSIVGLNGAGKTTMIKLICRLYRPTKGAIFINGHDIFEYDHKSYMSQIAAVFQDYKLFAFSIDENITCNELNSDIKKTMEIIKEVGLERKIDELANGLASLYGKAYDEKGIELSGGESQKVAIARALYKDASLIILDEPTSALDPLAEAEIYEHFNSLVGDKTAIYISHRMSSSVFCDKILVIDNGRISDYDSHKNLLKNEESLYTQLFKSQAVNYQLN